MHIIEPCCAKRHLLNLRNAIGTHGTADFEGYGDLSLTELLPALLLRYDDVEMMIVLPTLPDQAAEAIADCLRKHWARMDGKGHIDVLRHLTIVAGIDGDSQSIAASWQQKNPFGERLTLVNRKQADTAILLPDIALYGPINLRYGHRFTATATTVPEEVERLWNKYKKLAEPKKEQEKEAPAKRKRKKKD